MASRMAGSLTGKTQSYQGKWYYCKAVWLFFLFCNAFAFRLSVCIRIRSHTALRLPFFAEIHCAAAGLTVWLGAIHAAIQPYGSVVHSSSPTARNPVSAWVVGCARSEALQPYGWDAEPYAVGRCLGSPMAGDAGGHLQVDLLQCHGYPAGSREGTGGDRGGPGRSAVPNSARPSRARPATTGGSSRRASRRAVGLAVGLGALRVKPSHTKGSGTTVGL
jgi:hypothetical protein